MTTLTPAMRQCVFDLAMAGRTLKAIRDCTGIRSDIVDALWREFHAEPVRSWRWSKAFRARRVALEKRHGADAAEWMLNIDEPSIKKLRESLRA